MILISSPEHGHASSFSYKQIEMLFNMLFAENFKSSYLREFRRQGAGIGTKAVNWLGSGGAAWERESGSGAGAAAHM